MNENRCSTGLRAASRALTCVGMSLALSLTLSPAVHPALADESSAAYAATRSNPSEPLIVKGVDTLSVGGGAFDVATAVGLGASTLYGDVSVGGSVRQHDLPYSYDDADDQAGMVSLNVKPSYVATHSGKISLNFYTAPVVERQGADPVLSASVYAVAMKVDGERVGTVADAMIGIRTAAAGDETLPFEAPRLVVRGNDTYRLAGSSPAKPVLEGGVLYVSYEKVQAEGAAASISYVDEDGNVLLRDDMGALAAGESKTVAVRDSVEAGGRVYVPVSKMPTVTVSAAQPEVVVHCLARREQSSEVRTVNVSYASTDGTVLMRDAVDVGVGGYRYAPPTVFSQASGGSIDRYVLVGAHDNRGNAYTAEQAAELAFALDGPAEYTLGYEPQNAQLSYTVNIALVSPADGGRLAVETVESRTAQVSEGAPATVALPATYERDGETYARFGSDDSLTYSWEDFKAGRMTSDTVYYTRSDVEAPAAYDVNVRYVDVVSGKQLGGQTLSCEPNGQALQISGPESIEAGGASYTRLTGQEAAITHRFYAPYRTYTIYYAQPGALLDGDVKVVRTEIVDGGVRTYVIDPATGAVASDDASGGLVGGAPYATIESTSAAADGEGATGTTVRTDVAAPDGGTVYEERIADDETPLAKGAEGDQAAASAALPAWWPAALAAVAAAAAACIAFFMRVRKRKVQDASGSDEAKGE